MAAQGMSIRVGRGLSIQRSMAPISSRAITGSAVDLPISVARCQPG